MNRFWMRRIAYAVTTTFAVASVLRIVWHWDRTLRHEAFLSGYLLLIAVVFLALFNLRKRLNFIPLGTASGWMQAHIYVGLGASAVFVVHTGARAPTGVFETALYIIFAATTFSGLAGLYWTRAIPARLTKLREEIIYERIPAYRARVQRAAHGIVSDLIERSPTDAVADFYLNRLIKYFVQPRSLWYYLVPSSGMRNDLQHELAALTRYLSTSEREAQQQLKALIDQRDDLDYHHAQQGRLKLWLFIHLGLTVVLLVLTTVHVIMVHAFTGWA